MILKELSEAMGVSGNESAARAIVRRAVRDVVDELRVDNLGNTIALKRGTGTDRMRVLVAAHIDEVGFMVVAHTEDGFLRVRAVGGIDDRLIPGCRLLVGKDMLPGVIGLKPVHLLKQGEQDQVIKLEALVVDVGAGSKGEAEKLAPVGTYATFDTSFRELGPTVTGKAFDDRAGCAVLVDLLQGAPFDFDLYGVFTVQEEVGMRGARVAGYAIEPDCAFVLEGTVADDLPKEHDESPTSVLGGGPAITVMDRSFIADKRLLKLLFDTASELGIPYQIKQPGIGGTDAGAIHVAREGVPSVTLAVPCRYIHSPVSMLHLDDFNHTVRLMRESLARLDRQTLKRE